MEFLPRSIAPFLRLHGLLFSIQAVICGHTPAHDLPRQSRALARRICARRPAKSTPHFVLTTLAASLLWLVDAFKGVWFAGYTEEPYTFKVLGKSGTKVPLLVADFLPDGEDLSIVAVDVDGDMHILEFDPDRKSQRFHEAVPPLIRPPHISNGIDANSS